MAYSAQASMRKTVCGPDGQKALQAFRILRAGYVVLPIVAGLDKFFHILTHWDKYLCGTLAAWLVRDFGLIAEPWNKEGFRETA